ncbi:MAG: RNA polymerase sigma-70 factor [Cyclobacteriaceae bacterium]|nr:RNA polymerase sigma-70 factor [Cyclobacteriaceae bacterium]
MAYPEKNTLFRVKDGDKLEFGRLYTYYRIPSLKFCVSLVKDEEEAENIVHEVFIKIWDKRDQIKPDLNFNSYLFTCLRNKAFDYLKEVKKSDLLKSQYLMRMETARVDDEDVENSKFTILHSAIDALSEKRKLILKMNVEEGKSYQEIAELLNISKNTVKNQLVKAKQILREKIDFASILT